MGQGRVRILILEDDPSNRSAIRQMLDSEAWEVRQVTSAAETLRELAGGGWTLVIASAELTGTEGMLFETLREISHAPATEEGKARLRVLFLVSMRVALQSQKVLETNRLPYALAPYHMNDFLEKVSDLLLDAGAIARPLRNTKFDHNASERRKQQTRAAKQKRTNSMFASRDDYYMTEEEIAEYEKQEEEERKKKKQPNPQYY